MIEIKKVEWDNFFSYGKGNSLTLNDETVKQVIADNGAGKTSILLILEELLFCKNHKGIKKSDLVNRDQKDKRLSGKVYFSKDNSEYVVTLTRDPSLKVSLEKNGVDISRHTGAQTVKLVEEIIGINYVLFNQLTYLSTDSKLKFLTDTDTERKKFLVKLFQLDKYLNYHEVFKSVARKMDGNIRELQGSISTLNNLLQEEQSLASKPLGVLEPEPEKFDNTEKLKLENTLLGIKRINANIEKNNKYKEMLEKLDKSILSKRIEKPEDNTSSLERELGSIQSSANSQKSIISKLGKLAGKCLTCLSEIDVDNVQRIISAAELELSNLSKRYTETNKNLTINKEALQKFRKYTKVSEEFERLTNLIDNELSSDIVDKGEIEGKVLDINKKIAQRNKEIDEVVSYNKKIDKQNLLIKEAIKDVSNYTNTLADKSKELAELQRSLGVANTLKSIFSTKGLISYKLQYLVLDLEKEINLYLSELSKGKFLLNFNLEEDKLNINIINSGVSVDISSLSTGELSLVEVATLLAVRKLMSAISGTALNLLFLDEVLSILHEDNKAIVLELLMKERDLNILVVSHGYEHPLVPKIKVIKDRGVSTIWEM